MRRVLASQACVALAARERHRMLGMVFTEFIELVEERFSPEVADQVLQDVAPANGGAYTAVGYYPHEDMVAMVTALAARTGAPVATLLHTFGEHLLKRFTEVHAPMFERFPNFFDMVAAIDGHIHVEVHKLYHEAKLPRFTVVDRQPGRILMFYESPRRLEVLAQGLLDAAARHYGEPSRITHAEATGPQGQLGVMFTIERLA